MYELTGKSFRHSIAHKVRDILIEHSSQYTLVLQSLLYSNTSRVFNRIYLFSLLGLAMTAITSYTRLYYLCFSCILYMLNLCRVSANVSVCYQIGTNSPLCQDLNSLPWLNNGLKLCQFYYNKHIKKLRIFNQSRDDSRSIKQY